MLFEKLFYKKRNIYAFSCDFSHVTVQDIEGYNIETIHSLERLNEDQIGVIKKKGLGIITAKEVINRLQSSSFILYLAIEKTSGKIAGSYWAYLSKKNHSWFDTLCLNKNEVLLCNAFVEKDHRKQGIYGALIRASHNHLLAEVKPNAIYTIVEQNNKTSDSVNRAFYSEAAFVNNLFKFFSINVFSVLRNNFILRLYFVPFGIKIYEK